jgi:hypothetical protein
MEVSIADAKNYIIFDGDRGLNFSGFILYIHKCHQKVFVL